MRPTLAMIIPVGGYDAGHPDNSLPGGGLHPGNRPPGSGSGPVDPGWGGGWGGGATDPGFGVGGGRPDNSLPWAPGLPGHDLPEHGEPKVHQGTVAPKPPEHVDPNQGAWLIVNVKGQLVWAWAQKTPQPNRPSNELPGQPVKPGQPLPPTPEPKK